MTRKFKGLNAADAPVGEVDDLRGAGEAELRDGFADLGAHGGGGMSPVWGALIGTGLASAGILVAKSMRAKRPKVAKYAGVVGLLAAGLPSVAAIFTRKYRRAGYLGLATGTIVAVGEMIRSMYVEPQFGAVEILGDEYDGIGEYDIDGLGMYQPEMTDGMGAGIEVLGQTTPAEAMGMYQPELTAAPLDVAGLAMAPYGGSFMGAVG